MPKCPKCNSTKLMDYLSDALNPRTQCQKCFHAFPKRKRDTGWNDYAWLKRANERHGTVVVDDWIQEREYCRNGI